jgi:hypothetical protein
MASRKLLTWRGSEGMGASPAPDGILVDWMHFGNGGSVGVDDSTIDVGTASSFTIKLGTVPTTNELATINGGTSGSFIVIRNVADITVKHGIGNIKLAGGVDFYMDFSSTHCTLTLYFDGTDWLEVSRATDIN